MQANDSARHWTRGKRALGPVKRRPEADRKGWRSGQCSWLRSEAAVCGGLGLNYAPGNATDVRTELGAHFDAPIAVARMPLVLYARAAWAHDFVSNPTLSAAFQSLPGSNFTVSGAAIPGDSALASAGAELFLTPRWTLQVKFDGEFANGSQTYAGSGTLRYTW
jgi:uncharacterized protein with beta-barrel porin domain